MTSNGTYVRISRNDFEEWLDGRGLPWDLREGTVGVYRLHLSDHVAIEIASSVSSDDEVMKCAAASMKLKLVSRITGETLNRKAQGQKHFKRTKGWRKTWAVGVDRMLYAFYSCPGFYDRVAAPPDEGQEKPSDNDVDREQPVAVPTQANTQVNDGYPCDDPSTYERRLGLLRKLWLAAARSNRAWTRNFAASVGAWYKEHRSLTTAQVETINRKLKDLGVV